MPHRVKNRHKPRHHTHKVKPSNLTKPGLPPLVSPTPTPAPVQLEVQATPKVEQNHIAADPVQPEVQAPDVVEDTV